MTLERVYDRLMLASVLILLQLYLGLRTASAHFQLNANVRVVHVLHEVDGIRILLRVPTALVLASAILPPLQPEFLGRG